MSVIRRTILSVIFVILSLAMAGGAFAQTPAPQNSTWFLAPDAAGIDQVWQLLLDQPEPRQITRAESDVLTFGASVDGLAVAYISGGQLWLQPIHTEAAEALASVTATRFQSAPIFSENGGYLAYADDGVWLYDLAQRSTRQLLDDVTMNEDASNMGELRIYSPQQFAGRADENPTHLVIDVGYFEWTSTGVVDLATGAYSELEDQTYTNLLPLKNGRVLVFGNGALAGSPSLSIAPSLDDINAHTPLISFAEFTDAELFAQGAVELSMNEIRVYGQLMTPEPGITLFYFTYDLNAGFMGLSTMTVAEPGQETAVYGRLSRDGRLLPVWLNYAYTESGGVAGDLRLLDMPTGELVEAAFPEQVGQFIWQP
ncbi:MAG: hypothetical protein KME04_09955 [Pleurocapsa minor GSE-CHR-MK-17-07R]|jgi:hypothetical protein|nr:hypothetical protein [Pleurocapsa minor GSE-CHR-MK 17-07R]